jgi:DNA-binding NtrC family response regulator
MKKTILIVDDEEVILDILKRRFERLGLHVLTAANGSQGIEIIKSRDLALVICDIKMPNGVTGMSVLNALKRHQPGTHFVATSGHLFTNSSVQEIIENGASLFVKKPFDSLNDMAVQIIVLLNVAKEESNHQTTAAFA